MSVSVICSLTNSVNRMHVRRVHHYVDRWRVSVVQHRIRHPSTAPLSVSLSPCYVHTTSRTPNLYSFAENSTPSPNILLARRTSTRAPPSATKTRCWVSNTPKSQAGETSAVQRSDTTDRFSSTRSSESYYQLPPLHKVEQPEPSVPSRLGAGSAGLALLRILKPGT